MVDSWIQVGDGNTVWADDTGGDRAPILLLHPGVGDSRIWEPILPALRERHRVIRFDSRGYGRSPAATAPYTLLGDTLTVMDHYRLGRVPIVGCSQGGGVACGLAVDHPDRVSALVLLCPGIPGYQVPPDPELGAEIEKAVAAGPDAMAELGLRLWARAGRTPEVVDQLRSAARAWISEDEYVQPDPPVFDRLGEISVPSSLLIGDLDRDWLIESARLAAAAIPGCVLVEVEGVDHLPPLRVPDRVLELITATVPA